MCGISAAVSLDTDIKSSRPHTFRAGFSKKLEESLNTIRHRGPDAQGQWISSDNSVALGHVRLAIIDLSCAGEQPFHSEEHGIHVVVNGEFYDYEQIKEELATEYHFQSESDSEIVIVLYLKYGMNFLAHLRGEFSLCLYDAKQQFFVAARDRYGVKPLFWTVINNTLHLASEAKAFLPFGWTPEWDVRSILEDGWLQDERTLFKGVKNVIIEYCNQRRGTLLTSLEMQIQPGHYMTCSSGSFITHRKYWDLDYPDKGVVETRTEEEMILGLRKKLLEAVEIRLRADVSIGVYLSGGIDSAIIAGMAANVAKEQGWKHRLNCYTIGFEEGTEFDETAIAQRMADSLGVRLSTQRMNEKSMVENFEDAVFASEHCNPDLNSVGKFVLSNLPREEGFKVVLSGEGSDEHFGGYPTFLPDFFREPDLAWPGPAMSKSEREHMALEKERQTTAGFKGSDPNLVTPESLVARRMLNNTSISSHMWAVTMAHFAPWTKCYGAFSRQQARAHTPDVHVLNLMNSKWHPLHTSQYIWIKSTLTNWILTCMGDRMEMAHSIEGRTPFLDHVLTKYVNALPPSMKIRHDPASGEVVEKWILREAGRPFITEEIYKRKKHAFTAPILYPTGGHMHRMLSRLVTKENVLQLGFVDWDKAERLVDKAFGEKKDPSAMRYAMTIAQWVVLSQKFGVARAEPPGGGGAESKGALGKIWGVVKTLWSKFV